MDIMMVWIDQHKAKFFELSNEQMKRSHLEIDRVDHHTHKMDRLDTQRVERELFEQVAAQLKDSDQIAIAGPGVAKYHLQTYLTEQHPMVARKIVSCETVDHPSDPQMVALARKILGMRDSG